jgi:hypothetical protein
LTEQELGVLSQCFVSLPRPEKRDQHKPYNYYVGGLTFIALNDVHWQCEKQAFGNFFASLKAMMEECGELPADEPFTSLFQRLLKELFPAMEEDPLFIAILDAYDKNDLSSLTVLVGDVALMKLFCDSYFLNRIVPRATQIRRSEKPT